MKLITNWQNATVFDTETDGLLDEATKCHVLSFHMQDDVKSSINGKNKQSLIKFFKHHLENGIPVVAHNGISFDVPVMEKLLGINLDGLMVIDTLFISWYLNVNRKSHGLDSFFEDYGVAKPPISDWEGLTYAEYRHRCIKDVEINKALWEDFKTRLRNMCEMAKEAVDNGLVGGKRMSEDEVTYLDQFVGDSSVDDYIDRTLTFLMFKSDMARLREKTRIKLDVPHIERHEAYLSEQINVAKDALEAVMPPVAKYAPKNKPKSPYKKAPKNTTEKVYMVEGERKILSKTGHGWNEDIKKLKSGATDEYGNPLVKSIVGECDRIKVHKGLVPPNANSNSQLKEWLFSHGWIPETYKEENDEPAIAAWKESGFHGKKPPKRKIPQISKDGDKGKELCPSVIKLAEKVPEVMHYQKYTTVKHRLDIFRGFLSNMSEDGYIQCRVGGLTNTLREKHRNIVNLPGVDKFYGKEVRGSLIAGEGYVALGSDLSSLEDRTKHHYMLPYDPDYVQTMMGDDYDPHILVALSAGLITQQQFDTFMSGVKEPAAITARKAGKATNYASTYGAYPPTIALSAGVPLPLGKKLFDGYWDLNWSIKAIADDQHTFRCDKGLKWLVNPLNGMCYNIRKESDIFSTLNQGTGSFLFDMWIDTIMDKMHNKWNVKSLSLLMHDEGLWVFKDTPQMRDEMGKIVLDSIEVVNVKYKLRRKMGADLQYGSSYADCH